MVTTIDINERVQVRKDSESISIYIDGLFAGYGEYLFKKNVWLVDTLVYGAEYTCNSMEDAIKQTFEDYEGLGTNQRIRASILKDGTPVDLHELLMKWLEKGLSQDDKFYSLLKDGQGSTTALLIELMYEWGKIYYSKR